MITNNGIAAIRRHLAGSGGVLVSGLGVGTLGAPESAEDVSMGMEFLRVPVTSATYDPNTSKIYFKAPLPESLSCTIKEIGLWGNYSQTDQTAGVITSFDSETEVWSGGQWDTLNARIGNDSLKVTTSAVIDNLALETASISDNDMLQVAYTAEASVSNIKVDFIHDDGNFYANFDPSDTVYSVADLDIFDGNAYTIRSIEITVTGGAVYFDALKIHRPVQDIDSVLISRSVSNVVKESGKPLEIEYEWAMDSDLLGRIVSEESGLLARVEYLEQNGTGSGGGGSYDDTDIRNDLAAETTYRTNAVNSLDLRLDTLEAHNHDARYVRSVNNTTPDASGNVDISAGGGGSSAFYAPPVNHSWTPLRGDNRWLTAGLSTNEEFAIGVYLPNVTISHIGVEIGTPSPNAGAKLILAIRPINATTGVIGAAVAQVTLSIDTNTSMVALASPVALANPGNMYTISWTRQNDPTSDFRASAGMFEAQGGNVFSIGSNSSMWPVATGHAPAVAKINTNVTGALPSTANIVPGAVNLEYGAVPVIGLRRSA